jgi:cytidyltransferase-like protein|tara:strand:- start:3298 stop:4068 length:771 start_codon:yes stop_codon:yes gene_type:complete
MKVVVVSGGFDPIHSGHIAYLKAAKNLGDKLIVALNSDNWLIEKKGSYFMPFSERKLVMENLSLIDKVIDFDDDDKGTATNALKKIKKMYPSDSIIFANGGDRNKDNIPEMSLKDVEFVFSVGGNDKKNSSSWILKKWKYYNEERLWGSFNNLFEEKPVKVKELIIHSGKGTSYQKHFKRSEIWLVSKGSCEVNYSKNSPDDKERIHLKTFDYFLAPQGQWHQITNPFKEPCHIIEVQYGESCDEDDIERAEYYSP